MHSIIEIDIGGTGVISLDKTARARPGKGMRGLVVDCCIRFHLDNNSRTIAPNQFCADQLTSASERITFEKRRTHNFGHYRDPPYLMEARGRVLEPALRAAAKEAIHNSATTATNPRGMQIVRTNLIN